MNWARVIAGALVMWAPTATAWGYTLTWVANTESDLAGYRIYSCSVANCTRSSGNTALLATLGRVTTFNFGTPGTTQYYFVTAYDFSNNRISGKCTCHLHPVVFCAVGHWGASDKLFLCRDAGRCQSCTENLEYR